MKKVMCFVVLFPVVSVGSELFINQSSQTTISTTPVVMNCLGLNVGLSETTQCCLGSSCTDEDAVLFSKVNHSTCPQLVVDGYVYEVNSDIQIFNSSRLVNVNNSSINSCQTPGGGLPSLGTGFIFASGAVAIGIEQLFINESDWTLIMTSTDGNLTCQGGQIYADEIIFKNGFDKG